MKSRLFRIAIGDHLTTCENLLHKPEAPIGPTGRKPIMDKEHVKGAADKAKGAVKDTAGKLTDDKELQAEGKMDKAKKGNAWEALGDAKDAVKRK